MLPETVSNKKAVDTVGDSAQFVPKYPPPLTAVLAVMVSLVSAMALQPSDRIPPPSPTNPLMPTTATSSLPLIVDDVTLVDPLCVVSKANPAPASFDLFPVTVSWVKVLVVPPRVPTST